MNYIIFLKISLAFFLLSNSVFSTEKSIVSDYNLSQSLDSFYNKLKINKLLLRHGVKRQASILEKSTSKESFSRVLNYFLLIEKQVDSFKVNENAKGIIKNEVNSIIKKLKSRVQYTSLSSTSDLNDKKVIEKRVKEIKNNLINSTNVSDSTLSVGLLKKPNVIGSAVKATERSHSNKKKAIKGTASRSDRDIIRRRAEVKEYIVDDVKFQRGLSGPDYFYHFVASLTLLLIICFKTLSIKIKSFFGRRSKKVGLPSFTKSYEHLKSPVLFVSKKGYILWSNKFAQKYLCLTSGSTFFLKHELKIDKKSRELYYKGDNQVTYQVVYEKLYFNQEQGRLLTFVESNYEKPFISYRYLCSDKDGNNKALCQAIKNALDKVNYLFVQAGVPVFLEKRSSSSFVDEAEEKIFHKIILLGYHIVKDVKSSRVNIAVDESGCYDLICMSLRGVDQNQIDFSQELFFEGGYSCSVADHWHELELSLSRRNARIRMFKEKNSNTFNIQIQLLKKQVNFEKQQGELSRAV